MQLKDLCDRWCDEATKLEEWAIEFYRKLYEVEPSQPCSRSNWGFPKLNHVDRR